MFGVRAGWGDVGARLTLGSPPGRRRSESSGFTDDEILMCRHGAQSVGVSTHMREHGYPNGMKPCKGRNPSSFICCWMSSYKYIRILSKAVS